MELAQNVAGDDMDIIALQYMGIEDPKIRNLSADSIDKREMLNFKLLKLWSQRKGNNKEVNIKKEWNRYERPNTDQMFYSPYITGNLSHNLATN